MTEQEGSARQAVREALTAYRAKMTDAVARGEADEIKRLYSELGSLLEGAVGAQTDAAPVFSYPEIGPVVASMCRDMRGLVLDAGCGPYPIHTVLTGADAERTMVAMDIGHGTVRIARDVARRLGIRALAVVGDVEALPFADRAFVGAICGDTIEHLPDDETSVAELSRVLDDGRRLVLVTPNRLSLDVLTTRIRDRLRGATRSAQEYYVSESHLREYSWGDLRRLVAHRFRIVGSAIVPWPGGRRWRIANALVKAWPLRLLSRVVVYELEPRR